METGRLYFSLCVADDQRYRSCESMSTVITTSPYVEDKAQIRFDFRRINHSSIARGELLNFVGAQARIKRVLFENSKRLTRAL